MILRHLFGGGAKQPRAPELAASEVYKGFSIAALPIPEGGQFRLAADIEKEIDGARQVHRMIRADLFPTRELAAEFALQKARRIIDEQGDALFRD